VLALRSTATHTKEADTAKRLDRRVFGGGEGLEEGRAGRQSVGSVLLDGALPQLFYHRRLSLSLPTAMLHRSTRNRSHTVYTA